MSNFKVALPLMQDKHELIGKSGCFSKCIFRLLGRLGRLHRLLRIRTECLKRSQTPATSFNSMVLYQRESHNSNAISDFIQAFL